MESNTEQVDYLKNLARDLSCDLDALRLDFENYCNTHYIPKEEYVEFPYYVEPEYQQQQLTPVELKKKEWRLCEARLFIFARADKSYAKGIDNKIKEYLSGFSESMRNLWFKLLDEFYENYSEFDEGAFIKMLSEEQVKDYLELVAFATKDKVPYTEKSISDCIEKLKELNSNSTNKYLSQRMNSATTDEEKLEILREKINNKRKQNELKKSRRK